MHLPININDLLHSSVVESDRIDVFEKEPPSKDDPLLTHPKVFVTPHCTWNTKEAVTRLSDACIENLRQYLSSEISFNPA